MDCGGGALGDPTTAAGILDEATQERLAARIGQLDGPGSPRWRYLLSRGRLTSACRAAMAGAGGARIGPSYACTAQSSGCGCGRVPAQPLEQAVLAAVVDQLEGVRLGPAARVDPQQLRERIAAAEAALVDEVATHICRGSPGEVAAEATAAMGAKLERLRACLAQAQRSRGRHQATLRLARLGQRTLTEGQSTPPAAADFIVGLGVRVRVLETVVCAACAGAAKRPAVAAGTARPAAGPPAAHRPGSRRPTRPRGAQPGRAFEIDVSG